MMGAPGIQPHYTTEQVKQDPLSDSIRENLVSVAGTTKEFLEEALAEASAILGDPNASLEERQKVAEKLQRLTQGANKATESVEHFTQAETFEKKIVETALQDDYSADDVVHAGIIWQQEAANYYNNSKSCLLEAGQAISPEMSQKDPKTQRTFWKKVADAALGIEVMLERVNSLPERLAESIKQNVGRRIDAVNDTFARWADQTENSYLQLRDQTKEVAQEIVDHSAAATAVMGDAAKSLVNKIDNGVSRADGALNMFFYEKVLTPLSSFIENKVVPTLRSVGENLYEGLSDQVRQTSMNYKNVLQARRSEREASLGHALSDDVWNNSEVFKPASVKGP